jgi:amino acid transporter
VAIPASGRRFAMNRHDPAHADTAGLEADAVSLRHVLGEGFTSNGPLASAAVAFTATAAFGLGALPLTFALAAVVALTWINTPFQFSRRIASAGGLYAFLRESVGPRIGFSGSVAYFFYYVLIVPANALVAAGLLVFAAGQAGIDLPSWSWLVVVPAMILPAYAISYFRLRPSLTYGVITGAVEAVVLVSLSVLLIAHAGHHNTVQVFNPRHALNGWGGVAIAMGIAATALGGPDAVVSLGEEASGGHRTIRRALLITQTSVIGLYLLFSYAATVGWGLAKMAGFSVAPAPLLTLTHTVAGPVGEAVVTVLVLNSIIGVNLAVNIAMGRMLLDQARMGAVPRRLARIHPVHHTPVTALTATVIVQLAVAYAAGAAWGLIDGFIVCIVAATAGAIVSQLIANIGLILYRDRLGAGAVGAIVIPAVAVGLLGFAVYGNFFPVSYPAVVGPLTVAGCCAVALAWTFRVRRRATAPVLADSVAELA